MTLGEWLDTVIRKDAASSPRDSGGRADSDRRPDYGDRGRDQNFSRNRDRSERDFRPHAADRRDTMSESRHENRGTPRRERHSRSGGMDRRTEDALHAVERWLRDSRASGDSRDDNNRRLNAALDAITRRLDSLDERIIETGPAEISAIRETMDRLEHRIEDVTHAALQAGQHGRDRFQEDLERRVADIGRRIEDMSRNQSTASNARLERLEQMLETMGRSLSDRTSEARGVMNGPRRAQMLSTTAASSNGGQPLHNAIAEIRAHKLRLDQGRSGNSDTGSGRDHQDRAAYERVAPAFDTIRAEIAKLASQIADAKHQPDIGDLRQELSALRSAVTQAVETRTERQPALPEVLDQISARMQQEFAAMNRAVHERLDAAIQHDGNGQKLAQLVPALDTLSQRLETSGSRMATDLRRDFQTAIADLRQAVVQRPASAIEPVEKAIRDLTQRIEGLASQPGVDSAVLVRTNLELAEMREMIAKTANPLALDRIERQVETLVHRLDEASNPAQSVSRSDMETLTKELRHLARQFDPALALSAMDDKLRALEERIGRRMDNLQNFAGQHSDGGSDILMPDMSGLERMMRALSDKIDAARQPQAGMEQIEGLQHQIAQIASRLERSDEGTRALASIERAVSDLFAQIDGLRSAQRETAEIAAEEAARLLSEGMSVRSNTGPAGGSDPSPQLAALADDVSAMMQARETIDRKTQNTLEAVHGALEQIVGRLNSLETEVTSQTRRPAEGMPVRAAIEAATQAAQDMGRVPPRGMDARIAGAKASAQPPAPVLDPSVLAKPGSRRGQPVPPEPEPKPSRFSLKLPFLKGKDAKDSAAAKPPAPPADDAFATADAVAMPQAAPSVQNGDVPLEPGSGRPGAEGEMGARLVAAARRAAQSAAQDTATAKKDIKAELKSGRTPSAKAGEGEPKSFLAARKKPILLGLAALTLAILSLNVVSSMMSPKKSAEVSKPVATVTAKPAAEQKPSSPERIAPDSGQPAVAPAAKQSAAPPTGDPPAVGTVMEPGKPLDITPAPASGSLLNPSPLNPPSAEMAKDMAAQPQPAPAAPAAVAALAPAEIPAGITSAGLKAGVQRGDVAALYEVGNRLFEGRGVPRDPKQAIIWFERAGQAGLVPAQFRVGNMYEKGIGVARDLKQARQWYGRAADKGNAKAIHNLGVIIAEGGDGKPDYAVASDLFRRAAQFGVRDSQYNIAILLARGLGVGQSMTEAYTWFALAAAQGDDEAGRKRDEVAARLSPEDLAAAKDAVTKFKPLALDALANEVPERTWDAAPAAPAAKPKTSNRVTGSARI